MEKKFFEHLFKRYFKELCLFARQFITELEKCEDIVQEVFLNVWERGDLPIDEKQARSYLLTSVRNRCLNYIRDHKKLIDTSEFPTTAIDYSNQIEYKELEKLIRQTIENLPPTCRKIFEMHRFGGLKYQEIAQALNISVKTVEAQMSKALKTLREKLEAYTKHSIFFFVKIFKLLDKGSSLDMCL